MREMRLHGRSDHNIQVRQIAINGSLPQQSFPPIAKRQLTFPPFTLLGEVLDSPAVLWIGLHFIQAFQTCADIFAGQ